MRLMVYNIYEGGVGRIDPIAEVIRQQGPEVVVVPEASDREGFQKLADRLRMDAFLALRPKDPSHGAVGLLSRLPILEAVNLTPLDGRFTRAALAATVQLPGGTFSLIGLHLHARETREDEAVRLGEIPAVLDAARVFRERRMPHTLLGDFNAHHPEQRIDLSKVRPKTLERIGPQNREIPRQAVQALLDGGYRDAHALKHRPEEFGTSLTTTHPALRVDYVFVPSWMEERVVGCEYPHPAMARFASDHFPLVAEVEV